MSPVIDPGTETLKVILANPADRFGVALRLGWAMAEARGRYRLWDSPRLAPAASLPSRAGHALPLSDERTTTEQRVATEHLLQALAQALAMDPDYTTLPGQPDAPTGVAVSQRLTQVAGDLVKAHAADRGDPGFAGVLANASDAMAQLLYGWDTHIQDKLGAEAFGTASAYQLGRGLAETFWALDPTATTDHPTSWDFLLGKHRCRELTKLLTRLGPRFGSSTTHAVSFGLGQWSELARDPAWRAQPDAVDILGRQVRLWQDLLLTDHDPASVVDPLELLKRSRQVRGLVVAFLPELIVLLVALGVLSGAGFVLNGHGGFHAGATALAILGSFGITGAGLAARAKTTGQQVLTRLRSAVNQDVINTAVTLRPPREREWDAPDVSSQALPGIEHVIVLCMENRSFDHMLGFLDHPDPSFDGLLRGHTFTNPSWSGGEQIPATPDAKPVLPIDPDHSHDAVMAQLGIDAKDPSPTNRGFVQSYERKGRGLARPSFGGLLGPLAQWITQRSVKTDSGIAGRGPFIMGCQTPESTPVLSTLAKQFAVCTRWFCSVPGETWPNRNFLHAATSDGETDIQVRFYDNKTIFELLEENGATWRIYHDDTPQVWAFKDLWDSEERHRNWYEVAALAEHVQAGRLATYSFIEPNHRPTLHTLDRLGGEPDVSDSQHPGNNLVSNDVYDTFVPPGSTDFSRGEALIASVYEELRNNPELFAKTILVVTYDEHGGFFDHVAPPTGVPNPGTNRRIGAMMIGWLFHRRSKAFDFTMLGPRVPAVVVSPLIPPGIVSTDVRDHACIPATLRSLFAPRAEPLTKRDAWAKPLHGLLTLRKPRTSLPDLSAYASAHTRAGPANASQPIEGIALTGVPDHYRDLAKLSVKVANRVERKSTGGPRDAESLSGSKRSPAELFLSEADRIRRMGT